MNLCVLDYCHAKEASKIMHVSCRQVKENSEATGSMIMTIHQIPLHTHTHTLDILASIYIHYITLVIINTCVGGENRLNILPTMPNFAKLTFALSI